MLYYHPSNQPQATMSLIVSLVAEILHARFSIAALLPEDADLIPISYL
jgi:hypothetical protein